MLSTQANGSVLWREHYQPYGARQVKSLLSGNNEHWFAGKPQDVESGLSYFRARYYDPVLGRFMGVDPVGANPARVHGLNRYAYANNNPYRYVDPDGRYADLAIEAASISVGVVSLGGAGVNQTDLRSWSNKDVKVTWDHADTYKDFNCPTVSLSLTQNDGRSFVNLAGGSNINNQLGQATVKIPPITSAKSHIRVACSSNSNIFYAISGTNPPAAIKR